MTARPAAPELTEAERRFLDRPDAPEALRERVARALEESCADYGRCTWEHLADAALAVVRGET